MGLLILSTKGKVGTLGFIDNLTGRNSVVVEALQTDLAATRNDLEILEESLVDAQLALDDRGWSRIGGLTGETEFTRDYLNRAAEIVRAAVVANPMMKRGMNLRIAYVWGTGCTISARQDDKGQDVNAVVQSFLDDPSNQASFTSSQAHEELERALGTDGNIFLALFTNRRIGRVQVRSTPPGEVTEAITNPEDRDDPWFYKRTYTTTAVETAASGLFTRTRTVTVYHPALGYTPRTRPRTLDGHEIMWDAPMVHVSVNRLDGWKWGIGDAYASVSWARGYSEFLQDWAKLVKALSQFAFRATATSKRGGANVRGKLTTAPAGDGIGGTVIQAENQKFEAIGKSGATIDSESGKPLAAMVAAGLEVPVTMLLSDPGQTGARAVAETLDQPTILMATARRRLWSSVIVRICEYVIAQSVKAPGGTLKGNAKFDPDTGHEVITLTGDEDAGVEVSWPPIDKTPTKDLVETIVKAWDTGLLPPELMAQELMQALEVDNIDEVLKKLLDVDGNFVFPEQASAAGSALDMVNAGQFPG